MNKLHFQLVTPEKTVLAEELDSLSCPTSLGQITVLPGHIPLVANLVPGELIARTGKNEHFLSVTGGFVEVRPNDEIIVLADAAEYYYEIDTKKAEEAKKRAQRALAESKMASEEYATAAAALERSLARLNVARKHAHRKTSITGEGVMNE
jgi:F-type H+-transporting ATPase subunit epsilon